MYLSISTRKIEKEKFGHWKMYKLMKKYLVRYLPRLTLEYHPKWPFLWLLGDMAWKVFHDSDFYSWISLLEPYSHLRSESSKCKKYSERSHKDTKSNCKKCFIKKSCREEIFKTMYLDFHSHIFQIFGLLLKCLKI